MQKSECLPIICLENLLRELMCESFVKVIGTGITMNKNMWPTRKNLL